jgi:hypothetical protein
MTPNKQFLSFFLIVTSLLLQGQTFSVIKEYPAEPGLHQVLVDRDSTDLVPRYCIYSDHLSLFESSAPPVKFSPQQPQFISRFQYFFGLLDLGPLPANPTEPQSATLTVYSSTLENLTIINDQFINAGKIPSFIFSDGKQAIIRISPNGERLTFYDRHGQLLREKQFARSIPHNYEPATGMFSQSGERFAYFMRKIDEEENQTIPFLYLLSTIGEEIWKHELTLRQVVTLTIASSGKLVAIAGKIQEPVSNQPDYQIIVFDSLGNIQSTLPYRALHLEFNPAATNLLIADEQSFRLIDLATEGVRVSERPATGKQEISDLGFLNDSTFAIATGDVKHLNGQKIFDNPTIYFYQTNRIQIDPIPLTYNYSFGGRLLFSRAGDQVGFTLHDRFLVIQPKTKK